MKPESRSFHFSTLACSFDIYRSSTENSRGKKSCSIFSLVPVLFREFGEADLLVLGIGTMSAVTSAGKRSLFSIDNLLSTAPGKEEFLTKAEGAVYSPGLSSGPGSPPPAHGPMMVPVEGPPFFGFPTQGRGGGGGLVEGHDASHGSAARFLSSAFPGTFPGGGFIPFPLFSSGATFPQEMRNFLLQGAQAFHPGQYGEKTFLEHDNGMGSETFQKNIEK